MARAGFKNVTRKRPCLVCGKPDWCSYKEDESVSYCARVTTGADRLTAKEGRGVFYHNKTFAPLLVKRGFSRFRKNKAEAEIGFAPLDIRDFVYQTLLRLSPSSGSSILTAGAKGLAERGLTNFDDYGALPAAQLDRRKLANELRLLLNRTFPNYLRENPYGLRSVPGFWLDERGEANLWLDKDYKNPLLLIPYRTPTDKIQACQLRAMGEQMSAPSAASRYYWLSVPKRGSAGCGTPLHCANWRDFSALSRFRAVLVTEGALKADTVKIHLPDFYVVANSGVNCAHEVIINISRGKPVFVAFDKDYHENPAVVRQLARLLKMRLDDNRERQNFASTKILTWSGAEKGIDDALLNNNRLTELSALDWFQTLSSPARAEAEKVWET